MTSAASVTRRRVAGAEHPGLRLPAEQTALLRGDPCGGFLGTGDGKAEVIEQATGALVHHVGGNVVGGCVLHEVQQGPSLDRGPVVITVYGLPGEEAM